MREHIECPSCGERVLRGSSCEACITWREESDAEIAQLKRQLAEREETNKQVTTALVQAEAELEQVKRDWKSCDAMLACVTHGKQQQEAYSTSLEADLERSRAECVAYRKALRKAVLWAECAADKLPHDKYKDLNWTYLNAARKVLQGDED